MKGLEPPPTISSFEIALVLVVLLAVTSAFCSACASMEVDPQGKVKLDPGTNGCAMVELDREGHVTRAMIQHNGMSNPLAGTLRSIIGSAAGVFGGGEADNQRILSSEGCAGMMRLPPPPPEDEKECEQ